MPSRDAIAASAAARAWCNAAADLGIRFESPFAMQLNGRSYWCAGWLPDFGSPKGMIIVGRLEVDEIFDVAVKLGFATSLLNPYHYDTYDRELFAQTLSDWGWCGPPEEAPPWYDPKWRDKVWGRSHS